MTKNTRSHASNPYNATVQVSAAVKTDSSSRDGSIQTLEEFNPRIAPRRGDLKDEAGSRKTGTAAACFHCGEPCPDSRFEQEGKLFCCNGCLTVHDILAMSGLGRFYELNDHPGTRIRSTAAQERWACLDTPEVQQKLLDFTDGKVSRVTFQIPAIHCVACVWLLENVYRLKEGIGRSQVNFSRREVAITFYPEKLSLSRLVGLLASIGYEPLLTLGELGNKPRQSNKKQWLQVGIAGFAFGNIMLFSLPGYMGLDSASGPVFKTVFGWLSLALALPVLLYSASDYWRSALHSWRQRSLTLDVPIALGLAALYAQSAYEIFSGHGEGFLDSMAGLIFFLLCGRVFQQKSYDRILFDRDYTSFFPLSVMRKTSKGEENVALSQLQVGDRICLRKGELIPADSIVISGDALIDYSFVTGEAEPVSKSSGDYLYAGGQQIGGAIELETVKPVSQSYLTSLWNDEAFRKKRDDSLNSLTNRYSRRFTRIVIFIAVAAALGWVLAGDTARGIKAFTSVLIVACPCALALAAPFALGTAQRLLCRLKVFVKDTLTLERMARVDTIVFDKTGTLTISEERTAAYLAPAFPGEQSVSVQPGGTGTNLSPAERTWVRALTLQSAHPYSASISALLREDTPSGAGANALRNSVREFREVAGKGISGNVEGHQVTVGSRAWMRQSGLDVEEVSAPGGVVYVAIDGVFRGIFVLANSLRPQTDALLRNLDESHELALLSGDNEKERQKLQGLFGSRAKLLFHQSPAGKLEFIRNRQAGGKTVMMVGDGLNDAGALKQSDVGVAVVEKAAGFSPASDVIMDGAQVPGLGRILDFARRTTRIVRLSFGLSALYNAAGLTIAAAGVLSPVICAVLMPLSSVSVVLFAAGATSLAARKAGLKE